MPSKNIIKTYIDDAYYHIYNRGVEKRNIFLDESDCKIFLHYVSLYLSPVEEILKKYPDNFRIKRITRLNMEKEIDLLCFALMPNHFHFLIKQNSKDGIIKFMRRLMTSYVMYFNKKYERVGTLFQGRYKAILVERDEYLLHLTRYIHLNPTGLNNNIDFNKYSSYQYYLKSSHPSFIKPEKIIAYFSTKASDYNLTSYKSFVEEYKKSSEDLLEGLTLDNKDGP